jgi:hypothetical protein
MQQAEIRPPPHAPLEPVEAMDLPRGGRGGKSQERVMELGAIASDAIDVRDGQAQVGRGIAAPPFWSVSSGVPVTSQPPSPCSRYTSRLPKPSCRSLWPFL